MDGLNRAAGCMSLCRCRDGKKKNVGTEGKSDHGEGCEVNCKWREMIGMRRLVVKDQGVAGERQ